MPGDEYELIHSDCLSALRKMPDGVFDAVVTDPPAGIHFMGRQWDSDHGGRRQWIAGMAEIFAEVLRVTKPGGHALIWALPRTSHWTATAMEDAGWGVRDVLMHVFGSGFPKSHDISKAIDKMAGAERDVVGRRVYGDGHVQHSSPGKLAPPIGTFARTQDDRWETAPATDESRQWDGWGTALKPSAEHWILCRKPLAERTIAANVLAYGTGGINVDGCRVGGTTETHSSKPHAERNGFIKGFVEGTTTQKYEHGRWPPNLLLSHAPSCNGSCAPGCAVAELDSQSGILHSRGNVSEGAKRRHGGVTFAQNLMSSNNPHLTRHDSGGASRFFPTFRYVAKSSRRERNLGCEDIGGNRHCTVKPLSLMRWLCRLITPPGGLILDPFAGSGTTGCAAALESFRFVGIEREEEYMEIAKRRIAYWAAQRDPQLALEVS